MNEKLWDLIDRVMNGDKLRGKDKQTLNDLKEVLWMYDVGKVSKLNELLRIRKDQE